MLFPPPPSPPPQAVAGWDALIADIRAENVRTPLLAALEQPIPPELLTHFDRLWEAAERQPRGVKR